MGIYCAQCECVIRGGLEDFQAHLSKRHDGPFVCCEDACRRRKFTLKKSFFRHLRLYHAELCEQDSSSHSDLSESSSNFDSDHEVGGLNAGEAVNNNYDHENRQNEANFSAGSSEEDFNFEFVLDIENEEAPPLDMNVSLERTAARFILELRRRGNVSGTAISNVIQEFQKFLKTVVSVTKENIAENLRIAEVDNAIINQCVSKVVDFEPFKRLKTKDQQIDYFKRNFGYVEPQTKPLGYRTEIQIDKRGIPIPVQVPKSFQYIPVTETLKAVLNNNVLFQMIHSEKKSTDGKLRSFLDGSLAQEHPLISEYPHTIRITLHTDDVDCVNPLGSKTGIHKITELQFQIQNLPNEENAKLRSVLVLAYAYREDLPEDAGIDAMLEPFLLEMNDLESDDGVEIEVKGRPYTLRATLTAGAADALAAHEVLGLFSPSCSRFCSLCTVLKKDFHADIFAEGALRTEELHEFHLQELSKRTPKFMSQNYGVKKKAVLFANAPFTKFPEAFVLDGMHDILKGVAPMEIKLVLHELCFVKKYFSVFDFNARIQAFNVGPGDLKNKPSPNFTIDSVSQKGCYTMHQTAAQTWCLLQIFPFLVADVVPSDNPHLRLLVLLKRLSLTIFSHVISEKNLEELGNVMFEHHQLFFQLYPPDTLHVYEANGDDGESEDFENFPDDPENWEDYLLDDSEDYSNLPDDPEDWENYMLNDTEEGNVETPANDSLEASQEIPENGDDLDNVEGGHSSGRKKKKPKKIKPINKLHHLLHYLYMIRKFGPAVLYWCMRFEGKHALPKRAAAIVGCFKNIPVTFADLQQMNQCAELLDLVVSVKEEVILPIKGTFVAAGSTDFLDALNAHQINAEDILEYVAKATKSGYLYEEGLYLNLEFGNEVPFFGLIRKMYVFNEEVYIVTELCKGFYDVLFGAFRIEREENPTIRIVLISDLVSGDRPMSAWTADHMTFYISPRRVLAESLMGTDDL